VVALPRRDRGLPDFRLRPPRRQADLLGPQEPRSALPAPAGCPGAGVGRPRHPRLHPGALRRGAGHRPRARRHRDGAPSPPSRGASMMGGMGLELGLALLILLVFFTGLLTRGEDKRRVGVLAAVGLVVPFRAEPGAVLFDGTFVQDELAIFSKRLFLLATVLGVLASLALRAPTFARRATEYYVLMLA